MLVCKAGCVAAEMPKKRQKRLQLMSARKLLMNKQEMQQRFQLLICKPKHWASS